jgi:hypothetical protein
MDEQANDQGDDDDAGAEGLKVTVDPVAAWRADGDQTCSEQVTRLAPAPTPRARRQLR